MRCYQSALRRGAACFFAIASCLAAPHLLTAQTVTWSAPAPFNGQTATQILTTPNGSIVGAASFGNAAPVTVTLTGSYAPVVFGGYKDPTVASVSASAALTYGAGAYPANSGASTANSNMDSVLNQFATGASAVTIKLINLTGGATYSVQLFSVDDRSGGSSTNVSFQNPSDGTDISTAITESSNSYVIGTFTVPSGATSVSIQQNLSSATGVINALVVRAISFTPAINFTVQPTPQSLDLGDTATFHALATGPAPLTPQWKSGPNGGPYTNLTDSSHISGSSTYNLTINNITGSDASVYYVCTLTSGSTTATSKPVSLTALGNSGPVFYASPGSDINGLLSIAYNNGGGTVVLAPGTYYGSVNMYPHTTLKGAGMGSTFIVGTLTQAQFGDNMIMENLTVTGGVSATSYSAGNTPPAGIFFGDYNYDSHFLTWKNVEVTSTNIAMQLINVNGCNLQGTNFHDSGLGYSHSIYFTGDYGVNMNNAISSWSYTGFGAHLDFAGSVANYTFTQCEFNGCQGYGIFCQDNTDGGMPNFQMSGCRVQYNGQSGGAGDGLNLAGNGDVVSSRLEFNGGYGANIYDNIGLVYFFTRGNASGPYFSNGPVVATIDGLNPTFYYAELADGVTGPNNTADWLTFSGGNGMGAVEFNNNHSTNGTLTWPNVSAPANGVYSLQYVYANGSPYTLAMPMTVNGVYAGTVLFPPTGGWGTFSAASINATLTSNNNSVRLDVLSPGLGSPVLNSLVPNVGSIPAPGAVTGLTAVADNTAPLLAMVTWIKLSWNPTPGATDYNVYRNGRAIAVGISGTTFTDKHILGSHVTETYYVGASNAGGDGPAASITATSLTGYPMGLSATANPDYIQLSCSSSPGAVSYNVYRSQTNGGPYTKVGSSTTTSYTDVNVTNGLTYYYVMTATDGMSESLYSPQASATAFVPAAYTGPPVLLDVDFGNGANQSGAAVLGAANDAWNKVSAATSALVNSGGSAISGLSISLTDAGLYTDATANMDAATTALMRDFAFGYTAGSSSTVNVSLSGLSQFYGSPFTLVIYSGQGSVNATAMNITAGATGGNTASALSATGASRKISAGIGVAYNTFTGTISGSTLTFTDSPNGTNFSAMNGFQLMLSPAQGPAAPTGLATSASGGNVNLSWSAASGANYYSIGRSSTSGGPYANVGNVAGTSFTDPSAVNGLTYYYVVYGVNAAGPGPASNESAANTAGLPASQQSLDVGTVTTAGSIAYNSGAYALTSSGAGLTGAADSYRAVDETVTGDCEISGRVASLSANGQSAQAGVVIRETLAANAAAAATLLTPSAVQFLDRASTGATTAVVNSAAVSAAPYWVALKRAGNVFSSYISPDGANWTLAGTATIPMASTVHLGLAVASGGASIDHVVDHVSVPTAPPSLAAVAGLGQVTLSWGTPLDAVTYTVKRAAVSAGPFVAVAAGLTANSYKDFPPASGAAYYYTVSATDALGESPNATAVSATPLATLPISNYSFENPAVGDGGYETSSIPGWGWYPGGNAAYAVINPGAPGSGEPWPSTNPAGVDGLNFAQIYIYGTNGNGIIYQDTGIKYQAGVTYSLTAAFGLQTYQTLANGATMFFGNSSLSNLGSKAITAGNLSSGAFVDQTVNYTGTGSEAAGNGVYGAAGDVIIAFYVPQSASGSYLDFDNVRLNAVATSYPAYQQQYFTASQISNASISGASGDANGDGVSNLMAAALGLSPWAPAGSSLPVLGTSGGHLTLTFTRLKLPTAWTITVQVSSDLVNWQSGPSYTTQTSVTSVNANVEQATYQDNTLLTGNAARFMRLKVTSP
jgi:fibronectin type 3 domain-containing protein